MEVVATEDAASVILFDLRLSEGELEYFATALDYVLRNLNDKQLHKVFENDQEEVSPAETRAFIEGMWQESVSILREHCAPEYLPARFLEERE